MVDVEPIYCAEQIVVPPELAAVLKAFTKEVIRRQPEDLLDFSAQYFAVLAGAANIADGVSPPAISQLRQLFLQMRDLVQMDVNDFMDACIAVGITPETASAAIGEPEGLVRPLDTIASMLAMSAENVKGCLPGLFEVFGEGGSLSMDLFMALILSIVPSEQREVYGSEIQAMRGELGPTVTLDSVYDRF